MATVDARIEYNVNNPDDCFEVIVVYGIVFVTYIGLILEAMCFVFFIYQFYTGNKAFSSKYFYFLVLGYPINIISIFIGSVNVYVNVEIIIIINNLLRWYLSLFLGPWNAVLALNRFTALVVWQQHPYIWSNISFGIMVVFVFAYPLLANCFIIIENPICFLQCHDAACTAIARQLTISEFVSNGITVSISALLSSVPALLLRYKRIQISQDTKKMESHLLFQSLLSSIFFGCYCICGIGVDLLHSHESELNIEGSYMMFLFAAFSQFYYTYFHISSTLLLFFLSDSVRASFVQFYKLNKIFKTKKKSRPMVSAINSRSNQVSPGIAVF